MWRCVEYSSGSKYTLVSATASAGPARPSAERSGAVTSVNLRVRPRTPPAAPAAAGAAAHAAAVRRPALQLGVVGVRRPREADVLRRHGAPPHPLRSRHGPVVGQVGELRCAGTESVGELRPVDPQRREQPRRRGALSSGADEDRGAASARRRRRARHRARSGHLAARAIPAAELRLVVVGEVGVALANSAVMSSARAHFRSRGSAARANVDLTEALPTLARLCFIVTLYAIFVLQHGYTESDLLTVLPQQPGRAYHQIADPFLGVPLPSAPPRGRRERSPTHPQNRLRSGVPRSANYPVEAAENTPLAGGAARRRASNEVFDVHVIGPAARSRRSARRRGSATAVRVLAVDHHPVAVGVRSASAPSRPPNP